LLFDSEDVRGLAQAMHAVMSDKILAKKLGENGYRYALAYLSEDYYVNQFMRMIQEVTAVSPKS
jgi:hypothetical protein